MIGHNQDIDTPPIPKFEETAMWTFSGSMEIRTRQWFPGSDGECLIQWTAIEVHCYFNCHDICLFTVACLKLSGTCPWFVCLYVWITYGTCVPQSISRICYPIRQTQFRTTYLNLLLDYKVVWWIWSTITVVSNCSLKTLDTSVALPPGRYRYVSLMAIVPKGTWTMEFRECSTALISI